MARKKKYRPIAQEFEDYFGSGALEDWQRLCHDVGLEGYYGSITQCRKVSIQLSSLPFSDKQEGKAN
jgi:hypothetical protein